MTCAALPGNNSSTANTTTDVASKVNTKLSSRLNTNKGTRYPRGL
jgi:hypothetical protein